MTTSTYPTRRSLRLQSYDYSQAGAYFVTICTEGRACHFGNIQDGVVHLNPLGQLVSRTWAGLEERYGVAIDAYVVMPNHLHGVLVLTGQARSTAGPRSTLPPTAEPASTETNAAIRASDGRPALSAPEIVRRFKTFTANQARRLGAQDHRVKNSALWQGNFYERVIRNERELHAIREYVANNPLQWHLDRENPDR